MYPVDKRDRVVEIRTIPQSSVGSPTPILLGDEFTSTIAYYAQDEDIGPDGNGETIVIVRFIRCLARMFGPPNDETFRGHPLTSRGLKPYSSFLIENSSWLRQLEKMNSVHPRHSPKHFEDYRHFVLSFHDSTFECIAFNYEFQIINGSMTDAIEIMKGKLTNF
jgi:hypothetical protein